MFDSEDDRYRANINSRESVPYEQRAGKRNPIDVKKYKEMIDKGKLRGLTFKKQLWFQEDVEKDNGR